MHGGGGGWNGWDRCFKAGRDWSGFGFFLKYPPINFFLLFSEGLRGREGGFCSKILWLVDCGSLFFFLD